MISFEVWPVGWGFYEVRRRGDTYLGIPLGPYRVATVFGRNRAIAKARQFQQPIFSTADPTKDGDQ